MTFEVPVWVCSQRSVSKTIPTGSVCQSIQCRHQICLHLGYLISLHSTLSVIEFGRITRPENKCVNQDSLSLRLFPCSSHILHNSCPSPSCGTKLRHFITGNQFLFLGILSSFSTDIVALAFFCEISTTNEQRLLGSRYCRYVIKCL